MVGKDGIEPPTPVKERIYSPVLPTNSSLLPPKYGWFCFRTKSSKKRLQERDVSLVGIIRYAVGGTSRRTPSSKFSVLLGRRHGLQPRAVAESTGFEPVTGVLL